MAAGMTIYGDSGNIQITDEFFCYRLVHKATVTVSAYNQNNNPSVGATITYSGGGQPLIFFSGARVGIIAKSRSGSVTTWQLASAVAVSVTYYIFDTVPPTSSTAGLQIFDSAGALIFDSSIRLMRFIGEYKIGFTGGSATLPAGRSYAVGVNQHILGIAGFRYNNMIWSRRMVCAVGVSGTTITSEGVPYGVIPADPSTLASDDSYYGQSADKLITYVVDVTGY